MAWAGADVVDVGGESTRPGASPVEEKEEMRRVPYLLSPNWVAGCPEWPDLGRHDQARARGRGRAPVRGDDTQ